MHMPSSSSVRKTTMPRAATIAWMLLSASTAFAGEGGAPARDLGKLGRPSFFPGGPALHRDALLSEIEAGQRKLFAYDPKSASADHAQNHFLIVRDRYVSPGSEHALGILTPPDRAQPAHIREVGHADAAHLGRMLRSLMFVDRKSEQAPAGGFEDWHLYVNMSPAVPRLHVHAQPGRLAAKPVSDYNAFAKQAGYRLRKSTSSYKVWEWTKKSEAPNRWGVLAVGDAKLGAQAQLDRVTGTAADAADQVLGQVWLEAAALTRGHQVETSRSDAQIVARGLGW